MVELNPGRLGNRLFRVIDRESGAAYLKVGSGDAGIDINKERERLRWIDGRLPVPRVLPCEQCKDIVCLLITELAGSPSHECLDIFPTETIVEKTAQALREIHSIPIADCPFDDVLEKEFWKIERRLRNGRINKEAFVLATGKSPTEVFGYLQKHRQIIRANVFTHGDYALPNVLLKNDRFAGVIDWGNAGIADRHRDFMSVELTLRRNCGEKWIAPFYKAYGQDSVDKERVQYYWLLDQFFQTETI
jgi:aminoglycoside phosphotransferase